MAQSEKTAFIMDHKFDPGSDRHYLNGIVSVLHCHHYTTLYTQLAIDAKETDLLESVSEETFYSVLKNYYKDHGVSDIKEKIDLACQYFATVGMGRMEVIFAGNFSGKVNLLKSHVDEGWIKKWGTCHKPVNYIAAGFISALFNLLFDTPIGTYKAREQESIAMGAEKSVFCVEIK
jgi:hypothetical protein